MQPVPTWHIVPHFPVSSSVVTFLVCPKEPTYVSTCNSLQIKACFKLTVIHLNDSNILCYSRRVPVTDHDTGHFYGGANKSEEGFCFLLGCYEAFIGPWWRDWEVVRELLNSVALIPHNSEDITPRHLLKSRIGQKEIAASVLAIEITFVLSDANRFLRNVCRHYETTRFRASECHTLHKHRIDSFEFHHATNSDMFFCGSYLLFFLSFCP